MTTIIFVGDIDKTLALLLPPRNADEIVVA